METAVIIYDLSTFFTKYICVKLMMFNVYDIQSIVLQKLANNCGLE